MGHRNGSSHRGVERVPTPECLESKGVRGNPGPRPRRKERLKKEPERARHYRVGGVLTPSGRTLAATEPGRESPCERQLLERRSCNDRVPLVQRFRKAAEAWIRHWKCGGLVDRERDEASTSKVDRWRDRWRHTSVVGVHGTGRSRRWVGGTGRESQGSSGRCSPCRDPISCPNVLDPAWSLCAIFEELRGGGQAWAVVTAGTAGCRRPRLKGEWVEKAGSNSRPWGA